MKKLKENFKKHWKISLVTCVAVLCILGAAFWFIIAGNQNGAVVQAAYTVQVTDANGKSLEEVYVVLCAEDDTQISWLPYVTNTSGKAQFTEGVEEGCYVKVVGVPFGYALDESVKHTFDEEGNVTIVLEEDDSVYVAKIGDTVYASLATALGVANASSDDVTIELLSDTTLKTFTIKNTYGRTITINGNGHTVTAEGGNNTFVINQEEGVIAFENMTIKQKNYGAAVQINSLVTVNMTDVVLDATEGNEYRYALINTLAVDGTTTLNLTRVEAKMAVGSPAKADEAGIIRTGNTSGTKNVDINMVDCNFDTTGATGRCGIVVMKNTVANINIENSTIKAGDAYAIWAIEQSKAQTLTISGSQCSSSAEPFSASPIKGYAAQIGNTYYLTFAHAAEVANVAKKNVTIKVVTDVTMKTCTINNVHGKLVTVDGNGKTITTEKGNNAFVVGNNVAFKNMTINHKNTGSVIQVTEVANVTATDVIINATEGETYNYTLVNVLAAGETTTLNFTRVKATMAVESAGKNKYASIIMTGNAGDKKTVVMNLTDCILDTTKATGRCGIAVTSDATATVNLKNTTIKTKDTFAIRSNEQDINWNNADTTLTSLAEEYQIYPVEGYLTKIGEVFYTFAQALDVANAAKADTRIEMLSDYTVKTYEINNKNGKQVLIDGNGRTITTKSGSNAFVVGNNVAFENMSIIHKNKSNLIQVAEVGTIDLTNVEIDATQGTEYRYALINLMATGEGTTLNLKGVNATMSVAGRGKDSNSAIIRTGNNTTDKANNDKTVNINLTDCNFDTTMATGRMGIVVMKGTVANIKMANTSIKTLDVAAIKSNETSLSQTVTLTNCTLGSVTKEFKNEPIRGYEAQIGNTVYRNLKDAINAANASKEDVTIKLVYDMSRGQTFYFDNANGKAVTLDGDGHTFTTSGNAGNNTFVVMQKGAVEIKNMTLVHKNRGSIVQVTGEDANVKVTDVTVDATKPSNTYTDGKGVTYTDNYSYALFNMTVSSKLDLTRVKLDMDVETAGLSKDSAIIRTGNNDQVKTVDITLVDCDLDATGAIDRYGIRVMKGTHANIVAENTKIKTMNVNAIKSNEPVIGQATLSDDSVLVSGSADGLSGYKIKVGNTWYVSFEAALRDAQNATEDTTIVLAADAEINFDGIKNVNGKTITVDADKYCLTATGTIDATVAITSEAQIVSGTETMYMGLKKALSMANTSETDITIKLVSDITIGGNYDIQNEHGKAITIDGNGYTVTAEDANNTFRVNSPQTGNVELKDMTINQKNYGAVVQVNTGVVVNLTDVDINATEGSEYKYALINMTATDAVSTLNLTRVNAKMSVKSEGADEDPAIIRTGNNKDAEKTVNINLTDCNLDTTGATGRAGIVVMQTTTANIKLNNTSIKTMDAATIRANSGAPSQTIVMNGTCTLGSNAQEFAQNPIVGYGAQIGNTVYRKFSDALAAANASKEDVTIKLLTDITFKTFAIKNTNGKAVTIDGNEHVVTSTGGYNAFTVEQTGAASFENMTIVHKNSGAAIQMNTVTEVNLTDVEIDATTPETPYKDGEVANYPFALINVSGVGEGVSKLNLTNVNVDMDAPERSNPDKAIIRTGNNTTDDANNDKTVEITLTNCNLDAADAVGRSGIVIMKGTDAAVQLVTTKIKTTDISAIKTNEQKTGTATVSDDSEIISGNAEGLEGYAIAIGNTWYANLADALTAIKNASKDIEITLTEDFETRIDDIKNINGYKVTIHTNGYCLTTTGGEDAAVVINSEAKITLNGKTMYLTLSEAISKTNTASEDTTIEVLSDAVVGSDNNIQNENGKAITIDGNGYTVTAEGGNNTFRVNSPQTGNVVLKNMTINHKNYGAAVQVNTGVDVSLIDVEIDATEGSEYKYALINLTVADVALNLTRVNATMSVDSAGNSDAAIIRTGNNDDAAKTVDINLTDCNFDTTGATGRHGIVVMNTTTANIVLNNTNIKTMDAAAIKANSGAPSQTVVLNGTCEVNSNVQQYAENPFEGYGAQIENIVYRKFSDSLKAANASEEDVTIKLLSNMTIKTFAIQNKNGKAITIDGNGHTVTTADGNDAFTIEQTGAVSFENMTIKHKNYGAAIKVNVVTEVNLTDVDLVATEGSEYRYALINVMAADADAVSILNLTRVNATMSVASAGNGSALAILRTGNSGDTKNVNINLTDCNFDTTEAAGRSGIMVMETTTANIVLNNSSIKTSDVAAIRAESGAPSQTIIVNAGCAFNSKSQHYAENPIEGYDAQVGNTVYRKFSDALATANTSAGDTTIELLDDITMKTYTIHNENGKAISIDGNGHKVTTTGGNGAFVVAQTGAVFFKNMSIYHKNYGAVIQMNTVTELNLTDVNIDATEAEDATNGYRYSLINMYAAGEGISKLNLTNVNVDMDTELPGKDNYAAIIRTGNNTTSKDNHDKTVEITLTNCSLDASDAVGRNGIVIMNGTNANVELVNTKIKTKNVSAIRSIEQEEGTATIDDISKLVCGNKAEKLEGYSAQVGNTWYVNNSLLSTILATTGDETIVLTADSALDFSHLSEVSGSITIDTNGYCLATAGTKPNSLSIVSEAQVTVGEETYYLTVVDAAEKANNASADTRIELLTACELNVTSVHNTNGKIITIDTNGKVLTAKGTLWSDVVVVSQTKYVSGNTTLYAKMTDALGEANEATEDVTITLMSDITVKEGTAIQNANGKAITIDGNNKSYKVTTEKNGFVVNYDGAVCFKDMKISHVKTQSALKIAATADVTLTNVEIEATLSSGYQYGLINITATGDDVINLTMNQVLATMKVATGNGTNAHAIVRTGNNSDATKKVVVNLEKCDFDAKNSANVIGVLVGTTTDATINMTDSNIATNNIQPIYDHSESAIINKTRCKLSIKEGVKVAQVGNTLYESFADALKAANESDKAETIDLLSNVTISTEIRIDNAITLDGNMYIVETAAKNAIVVNHAGTVTFKNMTMNHNQQQSAIVVKAAATVNLLDMELNAETDGNTYFKYALINLSATDVTMNLNLTRVDATIKTGTYMENAASHAIIRTGNGNGSTGKNIKTVYMNLVDCTLDATEAPDRSGIMVMDTTTAYITLNNTDILTQSSAKCAPIYAHKVNTGVAPNAARSVSMTEDCVLQAGTSTEEADVIKNIENITDITSEAETATMSLEEETETKTLILEVPIRLYEALIDWIKQFAEANDWDLDL